MSKQSARDDHAPAGISKQDWDATPPAVRHLVLTLQDELQDWDATPPAVRRLVLTLQDELHAAKTRRITPELDLFPNRKSRIIFVARLAALVLMTAAVLSYALWDRVQPVVTGALAGVGLWERVQPTAQPTRVTALVVPTAEAVEPTAQAAEPTRVTQAGSAAPTSKPAQSIRVPSEDGLAALELAAGTKVTDAAGAPVTAISTASHSETIQWTVAIVGQSYTFGPVGATLDPPATLTFRYDPKAYYPFAYENIDCSQMHVGYFDRDKGATVGEWLDVSVDREAHLVTTQIGRLGTMVLFCEVTGAPISKRLPTNQERINESKNCS